MLTKLAKLSIHRLFDLVLHFPFKYQDRTRVTPVAALVDGDYAVVEAQVTRSQILLAKKRQLRVWLTDHGHELQVVMFNFSRTQSDQFSVNRRVRLFGQVRFHTHKPSMVHPEYQFVDNDQPLEMEETLTPIYSTTQGLSQKSLRRLIKTALAYCQRHPAILPELLPSQLCEQQHWPSLLEAIRLIHFPPPECSVSLLNEGQHPWQQRIIFEELLAHTLATWKRRRKQHASTHFNPRPELLTQFINALPFELTTGQQDVLSEIQGDLQKDRIVHRLLQGDVGAGKTVVAAAFMLIAIGNKHQAALMAPTEILAEQHFQTLHNWWTPRGIRVVWLAGKQTAAQRAQALHEIAEGQAHAVVGTHALVQENVRYHKLGAVVIDEQHRFGVAQRLTLRSKAAVPHQLIMTATPIPRTLAMTTYGDLDYSVLRTKPPGRQPIQTVAIELDRLNTVVARVASMLCDKQQVYWVCTLIDTSEELIDIEAATQRYQQLQAALPDVPIGLVHGKQKSAEREAVMEAFSRNEIRLLVATTVIEVGVDVPNATLMVIENPERLGLAQLHQLRGRVGRSNAQSYCVLLYNQPLKPHAAQRIDLLRQSNDGFFIAEQDLLARGPGEMMGVKQTGSWNLKIADLIRDAKLLQMARKQAQTTEPGMATQLIHRWIGEKEQLIHA